MSSVAFKTNIDDVFRDLDEFATAANVGLGRALNKLADQAEVAAKRKIGEVYSLPPQTVAGYLTIKPATVTDFEASINAKGDGFPLSAFDPRQTKKGVSVRVKGRRFVVAHSFMATMKTGHSGVFARGRYGGGGALVSTGEVFGRFQFGKGRLPINEFYSFAPPDTLANAEVVAAMEDRINEQASKVIAAEIRFAAKGR